MHKGNGFQYTQLYIKYSKIAEKKNREKNRQENLEKESSFEKEFLKRKTSNKLALKLPEENMNPRIALGMKKFVEEIEKIAIKEVNKYRKGFEFLDEEDLHSIGYELYRDLMLYCDKFKYCENQFGYFRTSLKNKFKDLLRKQKSMKRAEKKAEKIMILEANSVLTEQDLTYLKELFEKAPIKIRKIGEAVYKLLNNRKQPTNENLCKMLCWDRRGVNALKMFKDFLEN